MLLLNTLFKYQRGIDIVLSDETLFTVEQFLNWHNDGIWTFRTSSTNSEGMKATYLNEQIP